MRRSLRRFVEEGAVVVIGDLQVERGEALGAELGDTAVFVTTDVCEEHDVEAMVARAVDQFGGLDVFVHCAGIVGVVGSITETSVEDWDRTVAVILRGTFLGVKHAGRVMAARGGGSIVLMTSTAGLRGGLGPHCYTACKHGVVGLARSAASELGGAGVRVNTIAPGGTITPMLADALVGDHTQLDATEELVASASILGVAVFPMEIANAALYLASDEAGNVTGHTLAVDGGQATIGGVPEFHRQPRAVLLNVGRREPGSE